MTATQIGFMLALMLVAATAGVPSAAIAFAVPPRGPIGVPRRWWTGSPAPPWARAALAGLAASTAGLIAMASMAAATTASMTATGVVFIVLAVVDLRRLRLPHRLTAAAWVTAGATAAIAVVESGRCRPAIEAVGVAVIVAGALLGVALAMPGQLGLGDVNLISVVAFSLGWSGWTLSLLAVVVGLLVQAVVGVAVIAAGSPGRRALPLGPAMVAGWIVGVVALHAI